MKLVDWREKQNKMPEEDNRTPIQIRRDTEKLLEYNLRNDFYRTVLGTNILREDPNYFGSHYHNIGEKQYDPAMASEEATKLRQELYAQELAEGKKAKVADRPDMTSNYQLSKYISDTISSSIAGMVHPEIGPVSLKLGKLEEILKEITPGVNLKIPGELKRFTGHEKELSQKDSQVIAAYKSLILEAVRRGAGFFIADQHRNNDINSQGQDLGRIYREARENGGE